jgi:hypothetical protein
MVAPSGREILVGSPVEREDLIHRGYRVVADEKPATKPASVKSPEPKPAAKRAEADDKK